MVEDMADVLVWVLRLVLITGLAWGAWLCIDDALLAARPDRMFGVEHFATFALVVLLLISTLGGILHAG